MERWSIALNSVFPEPVYDNNTSDDTTSSEYAYHGYNPGLELDSDEFDSAPMNERMGSLEMYQRERDERAVSSRMESMRSQMQSELEPHSHSKSSRSFSSGPRRFLDQMRRRSLTDVTSQSTVYDLSIQMNPHDNLFSKLSPKLSEYLSRFYLSKVGLFTMVATLTIAMWANLWIFSVVFFCGLLLIVNRVLLKYMCTHSFDLLILVCSATALTVSDSTLRWDNVKESGIGLGLFIFNQCGFGMVLNSSLVATQCIDGLHMPSYLKQIALAFAFGSYFMLLIQPMFQFGDWSPEVLSELELHVPLINRPLDVRELLINQAFVIVIFSSRKLLFSLKQPDAVWVASFPELSWTSPDLVTDKLVSSAQCQNRDMRRMKSLTRTNSMDIFRSLHWQSVHIYLKEGNNNIHKIFGKELGQKIQTVTFQRSCSTAPVSLLLPTVPVNQTILFIFLQALFTKWNNMFACSVIVALLLSSIFNVMPVKLCSEFIIILELLCLLGLTDRKMLKYFCSDFDIIFTLINWGFYIMADTAWNDLVRQDLSGTDWLDYVMVKILCTELILIILFWYVLYVDLPSLIHSLPYIFMCSSTAMDSISEFDGNRYFSC